MNQGQVKTCQPVYVHFEAATGPSEAFITFTSAGSEEVGGVKSVQLRHSGKNKIYILLNLQTHQFYN